MQHSQLTHLSNNKDKAPCKNKSSNNKSSSSSNRNKGNNNDSKSQQPSSIQKIHQQIQKNYQILRPDKLSRRIIVSTESRYGTCCAMGCPSRLDTGGGCESTWMQLPNTCRDLLIVVSSLACCCDISGPKVSHLSLPAKSTRRTFDSRVAKPTL